VKQEYRISIIHISQYSATYNKSGVKAGVFGCVEWQVTLCDPIWQVTPCSSVIGFRIKNLSWLQLFTGKLWVYRRIFMVPIPVRILWEYRVTTRHSRKIHTGMGNANIL